MSTILDDPTPLLSARLRAERSQRQWSLAELADRSGVSKAMLSKIERAETSPTAVILVRIAAAFGLTLAQFLTPPDNERRRLVRGEDQPQWRDPATGYVRRQIFIDPGSGLELVEVLLPPGSTVSFPAEVYHGTRHVVWLLAGRLTLTEGGDVHAMRPGDRLEFGQPADIGFRNEGSEACRYLVAVVSAA